MPGEADRLKKELADAEAWIRRLALQMLDADREIARLGKENEGLDRLHKNAIRLLGEETKAVFEERAEVDKGLARIKELEEQNEELREDHARLQEWLDLANGKLPPGEQVMPRVVNPEYWSEDDPIWAPAMKSYQQALAEEVRLKQQSRKPYADPTLERVEQLEARVEQVNTEGVEAWLRLGGMQERLAETGDRHEARLEDLAQRVAVLTIEMHEKLSQRTFTTEMVEQVTKRRWWK